MTSIRSGTGSTFAVLTLIAVLGACGKGTDAARAAAKGAEAPAAVAGNAESPSTDLGGARMHLEITGGTRAGNFDRTMEAAGCMYGMSGPAAWHLSWGGGDPGDPNSLNNVTLDIPNLKATENGATPFALQVFFGSNENSTAFGFNTIASAGGRAGKGTVTVNDRGSTVAVTFDATLSTGVRLKGTFDCASVMRP